jgi:hypothetical protein
MIDFTPAQEKALLIWANEKLLDILDGAHYDGDDWFTVDESIPELAGKIDINIYDEENIEGDVIIRCVAYVIEQLPNGLCTTKCDVWHKVF